MNNYLSLNLVNGRLTRLVGGGRPTFILNELNSVQMYVLDYPKPSTYPTDALSDAYAYEILPRDFSSSSITLKAGVRGGASVLSTNSFFNIPTNIAITSSSNVTYSETGSSSVQALYNFRFSFQPIPIIGSLFSVTVTFSGGLGPVSVTSQIFSFENTTSQIQNIIYNTIGTASSKYYFANDTGGGAVGEITSNFIQTSDYSYSFSGNQLLTFIEVPTNTQINISLNNVSASSNPGKYGSLDFSSLNWNSVIGTKKEVPIWMEAMIDNETIAQGNAILCRKMT
jgi:hypothetical protein